MYGDDAGGKPGCWARFARWALRAAGWLGCCACVALVCVGCWYALAVQSMRHDPRRHGGGRHAGAHAGFSGAASVGGGPWPGVPPCVGVALQQPSAALAAPGGTWQPQPYFRRTMALRAYHGVAGRKPALPTWVVTSGLRSTTFGVVGSPFSPSGQFLALLRFPAGAEGCAVRLGEAPDADPLPFAEVLVVDLWSGTETVVAKTRGWAAQAGAHVQWGVSDAQLFYNDVVHGERP